MTTSIIKSLHSDAFSDYIISQLSCCSTFVWMKSMRYKIQSFTFCRNWIMFSYNTEQHSAHGVDCQTWQTDVGQHSSPEWRCQSIWLIWTEVSIQPPSSFSASGCGDQRNNVALNPLHSVSCSRRRFFMGKMSVETQYKHAARVCVCLTSLSSLPGVGSSARGASPSGDLDPPFACAHPHPTDSLSRRLSSAHPPSLQCSHLLRARRPIQRTGSVWRFVLSGGAVSETFWLRTCAWQGWTFHWPFFFPSACSCTRPQRGSKFTPSTPMWLFTSFCLRRRTTWSSGQWHCFHVRFLFIRTWWWTTTQTFPVQLWVNTPVVTLIITYYSYYSNYNKYISFCKWILTFIQSLQDFKMTVSGVQKKRMLSASLNTLTGCPTCNLVKEGKATNPSHQPNFHSPGPVTVFKSQTTPMRTGGR